MMKRQEIPDAILSMVDKLTTPGFFVTVEFNKKGEIFPAGLEAFIYGRLERIRQGIKGRKFSYQEEGWRIILTFFPTDQVVDEKYAMKNRFF